MKKIFLLATTLLFSIFSFAYEYVNDKYCVYKIDVGKQTAEVVNFCSEAASITIPASFTYQGDKYIVESVCRYDFEGNYDSKYRYYDYDKIRATIVEIHLPKTLKKIELFAFQDMTRLKSITIPSSVDVFKDNIFSRNERLEYITLEGLPCCEYNAFDKSARKYKDYNICLSESNNPAPFLDSMKIELKKSSCPRLQTIDVIPLNDFLVYKNKLNKSYLTYSKQLNDSIAAYKTKLTSHPYYFEDNYFNKIGVSEPVLSVSNAKENYATQSASLKKEYNRQLTLCREEYKKLWDNMEQNCKQNSPDTYADLYCKYNPEFSAQIDALLKDYKCDYTKHKLALAVLRNYQLGEKCQDKLWKQYSYLYKDKETFLAAYDMFSDIKREIAKRESIYNSLRDVIKNNKIQLKGTYDSDETSVPIRRFRGCCDEMKKYNIPVSREIINQDIKALKEFEKNGQYFASPDDFFAAYITSNYKNILKEKKKAK